MHIHCLLALCSYAHLFQWHGACFSASWTVSVRRGAKERFYMHSLYNPESVISFVGRNASAEIQIDYAFVQFFFLHSLKMGFAKTIFTSFLQRHNTGSQGERKQYLQTRH